MYEWEVSSDKSPFRPGVAQWYSTCLGCGDPELHPRNHKKWGGGRGKDEEEEKEVRTPYSLREGLFHRCHLLGAVKASPDYLKPFPALVLSGWKHWAQIRAAWLLPELWTNTEFLGKGFSCPDFTSGTAGPNPSGLGWDHLKGLRMDYKFNMISNVSCWNNIIIYLKSHQIPHVCSIE